MIDDGFIRALPKAELHAHLSGSISRETLHTIWLRKRSKGECQQLEDPLTAIRSGSDSFVDIRTFFPLFDKYIYALCNDVETVKFATEEVIQSCDARYLELRTTPRSAPGMQKCDYVDAVNEVVRRWNENRGKETEVNLILSIDRSMNLEQAIEVVDLAIQYRYGLDPKKGYVVGVDLCGNPFKGDVSIFTPAFEKAKKCGLGITAHFAEIPESSTDHELSTILSWDPDRLGHCIHVTPQFQDIIAARSLGLELCLSCNVLSGLTSGGFSKHHLGEWLRRSSCPVALSTDDVGVFGSPLSNEYKIAAKYFLNTKQDLINISRQAVKVAFAGEERMTRLIDEFEKEVFFV